MRTRRSRPRQETAGESRRSLLVDIIAGAIGTFLAFPLVGFVLGRRHAPPGQWVEIGAAEEFRGAGRKEAEYSFLRQDAWLPSTTRRRVLVASDPPQRDQFAVFSTTCTHLGCAVRWDEAHQQFLCPCHGGVFNAEGQPAGGPVERPLARLQARVSPDGQLEVLEA